MSNDYTNPNTNPKTLTTGILTLTYHDDAFESFCAPAFCDFIRNYSGTDICPLVTSLCKSCMHCNSCAVSYFIRLDMSNVTSCRNEHRGPGTDFKEV